MSTPPSETDLLRQIQLDASARGQRLLRNNVGALTTASGSVVRYGVGGSGGSDLIGWTPIVITPAMVGRTLAVFTAVEGKKLPRRVTPDQSRFIEAVQTAGGIACVAYASNDVDEAVARFLGLT